MGDTGELALVPFDPATHATLLAEWLSRPHVSRWFGPATPQLEAATEVGPEAGHVVVLRNGDPAGYMRWRHVSRDALDELGLRDIPAGSVDLDVFVADQSMTGRGIGPRALDLLTASLTMGGEVPLFGLTTRLENVPAQKAFEKAGFIKHCVYDASGFGQCWLMVKWRGGVAQERS